MSNWYVLMAGVPVQDKEFSLASGVTLRPLNTRLTVFDLAAVGGCGFREWAILESIAGSCVSEIETAQDSASQPGYDALNRAWLASALLLLRGFKTHLPVAFSAYSWNRVAGHSERSSPAFKEQMVNEGVEAAVFQPKQSLPAFQGGLLDFRPRMLVAGANREEPVTEVDARWIREHFGRFNELAAESESFRLALEAIVDWRYATAPRSAIARLWTGIEAIFGISSELVFRISLLTANLLENDGEARRARFKATKKLYGNRSKAVHGVRLTREELSRTIDGSYELLRRLLLLSVEKGHPLGAEDFESALFG